MPQPPTDSLTDCVVPIEAGAPVTAVAFLVDTPALALGDGAVLLGADAPKRVDAHPDAAVLTAVTDRHRIVTGGDDGRVVSTKPDGTCETIGTEKGGWIDALRAPFDREPGLGQRSQRAVPRKRWRGEVDLGRFLGARPRLRAEGLSPGDKPLQWSVPVVPEQQRSTSTARMEGGRISTRFGLRTGASS